MVTVPGGRCVQFRQQVPGGAVGKVALMQDGGVPCHPPLPIHIGSRFPLASVPYGSLLSVSSPVHNLPFLRTEYDISSKASEDLLATFC